MATNVELKAYRILLVMLEYVVDHPDDLSISIICEERRTTFRIKTNPEDTAKVIGNGGRMARSLSCILGGIALKNKWDYIVEIDRTMQTSIDAKSLVARMVSEPPLTSHAAI